MAKQNIFDNEVFFEGYKGIRDREVNANTLFEIPALFSLLPDMTGLSVLDPGGLFVFSQEHPLNTCHTTGERWTRDENGKKLHFDYYQHSGRRGFFHRKSIGAVS